MDIVGEAVTENVDMIVMGTHGRSGLKRLVMGSVTGKVLRHARCKVLVVPSGAKIDYSRILLVTDGSIHSSVAASEAVAVAARSNGSLTVVSVASSEAQLPGMEANVEQVLNVAEKHGVKAEGTTLRGKPEEAIAQFAKQNEAGLIVLGGYRADEGLDLPMGSVTERIIADTRMAVLVVRAG
jgi:nucleotide-binding universal stress UspA family protein